jgi:hypothetical protein
MFLSFMMQPETIPKNPKSGSGICILPNMRSKLPVHRTADLRVFLASETLRSVRRVNGPEGELLSSTHYFQLMLILAVQIDIRAHDVEIQKQFARQ